MYLRNPIAKEFYRNSLLWHKYRSHPNYIGRTSAYTQMLIRYSYPTVLRNQPRFKAVLDAIEAQADKDSRKVKGAVYANRRTRKGQPSV